MITFLVFFQFKKEHPKQTYEKTSNLRQTLNRGSGTNTVLQDCIVFTHSELKTLKNMFDTLRFI